MKKTIVLVLTSLMVLQCFAAKSTKKEKEPEDSNFTGIITYIGKVSRIPDKKKTQEKLGNVDSYFKLYMNDEFTRREENIEGMVTINIVEGVKTPVYWQTIASREGQMFIEATPEEQKEYGLTSRDVRYKSVSIKTASGKKVIKKYKCKKMICNMVTEDNIRVQLVAWYTPDLYIKDYHVPFFGKIKGLPLLYDFYNGEYVVTYSATDIKKMPILPTTFNRPDVEPITMTQYLQNQ